MPIVNFWLPISTTLASQTPELVSHHRNHKENRRLLQTWLLKNKIRSFQTGNRNVTSISTISEDFNTITELEFKLNLLF